MRIAVAGASGFVGRALMQALSEPLNAESTPEKDALELVALTRQKNFTEARLSRTCDLFSLLDVERGLEGCDYAYYLVHSMLPSAKLTQGRFDDFDLILADNFSRAAEKQGLKGIIYLGGIVPSTKESLLSDHLRSRIEVERALGSRKTPLASFRAGLIVGPGGSSLEIMVRLVERLPMMICPAWTLSESEPIALENVVEALQSPLRDPQLFGRTFDLAGPESLSYLEMMKQTAEALSRKRLFLSVPAVSPKFSVLWVNLVTRAPRALLAPLVESLRHEMKSDPMRRFVKFQKPLVRFREALKNFRNQRPSIRAFQSTALTTVRSVQRLSLPEGWTAATVAETYMNFLPRLFRFLIRVKIPLRGRVEFHHFGLSQPLMILEWAPERSSSDRQLLYVRGGLLSKEEGRGRLEFREVLGEPFVLAAVHDFQPRLPWFIYRWTQALAHLWVMRRFGAYLKKLS